jgi:hypothetical protein
MYVSSDGDRSHFELEGSAVSSSVLTSAPLERGTWGDKTMPRIWGWLALVPLTAATGCTALLGDFSQTTDTEDAGDGSVSLDGSGSDGAVSDATNDGKSDASDANVADVAWDGNCSGAVATITPSGTLKYCPGVGVVLNASPAAVYAWSSGATTQSITAMTAGTYSVTTVDSHGCRASSSSVTLAAYPAPTVPTITAPSTSFCGGSSLMLTASSAASYVWSTGATTQSTAVTAGGTYTVTTTDANGCPATSAAFTVTQITPPSQTLTFNYTGASQSWTVPNCLTSVTVDATGASGGNSPSPKVGLGGLGGRVQATLSVTPGQLLTIYVGGAGASCTTNNNGGTNGYDYGGSALCPTATSTSYPYGPYPYSGTGGASSDIRANPGGEADRILVAGAGGGAGFNYNGPNDNGGPGGGLSGGNAAPTSSPALGVPDGIGLGGTQTTGGAGATQVSTGLENMPGGAGSQGYGGSAYCYNSAASPTTYAPCGGGGGGGWYGGGSGCWGGGGGGSSYVNPALGTNIVHTQGYQSGNGYVKISW